MNQTQINILAEQFDVEYPNHGKLKTMLPTPGSPAKELKSVSEFTQEEKAQYMSQILFLRHYSHVTKAEGIPLIDPMDESFEVPSSIGRAYLASLI